MSKKMKSVLSAMINAVLVKVRIGNKIRTVKVKSYNDNEKLYVVTKDEDEPFKGMVSPDDIVIGLDVNKKLLTIIKEALGENIKLHFVKDDVYEIRNIVYRNKLLLGSVLLNEITRELVMTEDGEIEVFNTEINLNHVGSSIVIPIKAKSEKALYKKIGKAFTHLSEMDATKMLLPYKNLLKSK